MSVPQGVDVSFCQRGLDYAQLAKAGVQFAWIKALDWSSKGFFWDNMHDTHKPGFRGAGTLTGDYCFGHVTADPIKMADEFSAGCSWDELPPVLDMETLRDGLIPKEAGAWALAFLKRLEQNFNKTPILYSYVPYLAELGRQAPGLSRYPLWIAQYLNNPSPDHQPKVPDPWPSQKLIAHQWTGHGRLPGCQQEIDRNVMVWPIDEVVALCQNSSTSSVPASGSCAAQTPQIPS